MKWMILPLQRYADFSGRSRRLEYWMFQLFIYLVVGVLMGIAFLIGGPNTMDTVDGSTYAEQPGPLFWIPFAILMIFVLGIIIPSIAVTVRRLHDRDMSGWFYLISFIPYIGGLILFVFMVLPGTPGENSYGDDPLDPSPEDLEAVFH